jgi:uncharacterized membrane protein
MNSVSTRKLVINGMMITLVFLATYFTKVPIPAIQGYFNLGDSVIMTAAIILGGKSGLVAGAFGSLLADVASGYLIFAPLTFIVKGLEGLITGIVASHKTQHKPGSVCCMAAVAVGAIAMVTGYFIGEAYILAIFDKAFGYTAAAAELPVNLLQGGLSAVVAYLLTAVLARVNLLKAR